MVGQALALEGHHLLGHRHLAEAQLYAGDVAPLGHLLDEHLSLLLGLRVVVAVEGVDRRAPRLDVELADLVGAPEVQVDRSRMNGRERPLGLHRPEQLARVSLDDRHRVGRGRAKRDVGRGEVRAARQVAALAAAPQLPQPDQGLGALAPARPEELRVGLGERDLVGGGEHVGELDAVVLVIEDRRLHRPFQELVGMAAEELVEGVLAGDVERQPLGAPAGATPHLAQARDGAREGHADRRVQVADVDPQLECVGRHHREEVAAGEARLDLAALLRRVAGPVRRDPLGQLRAPQLLEPHAREALDQLDPRAGCAGSRWSASPPRRGRLGARPPPTGPSGGSSSARR